MSEYERKLRVRAAFDRAAPSYDDAAAVQRTVSARLLELARDNPPARPVARLMDAGCGTGRGVESLLRWLAPNELLAVDFAVGMLRHAGHAPHALRLCADLEALPLADGSIDALWSSLAMQWCAPERALDEAARVLRRGGTAWIATLGPRTLCELREAFRGIDDARHVIDFHSAEHWVMSAHAAGLELLELRRPPTAATAPTLRRLLRDIKAIGAHHVGHGRRRAPLGQAAWRALEARYERHRRADGLLGATYDAILLALRKPQ